VKVSTADGGVTEFKTKEGIFQAVSKVIWESFQLALVAQCHQGTFFKDISHLANGLAAQHIVEGMYDYPQDLNPATRLLFEGATAMYAALSPEEV
jgi:hypothetical protein